MPADVSLDDLAGTEGPVPDWRRETILSLPETRLAERERSSYVIRLPGGDIVVTLAHDMDEPSWVNPALRALSEIGSLPPNWDSYLASPVSIEAVAATLRLLEGVMTEATPVPAFVPTRHGGVQIEWHQSGVDIEIDITPSGRMLGAIEDCVTGEEQRVDITSDVQPLRDVLTILRQRA